MTLYSGIQPISRTKFCCVMMECLDRNYHNSSPGDLLWMHLGAGGNQKNLTTTRQIFNFQAYHGEVPISTFNIRRKKEKKKQNFTTLSLFFLSEVHAKILSELNSKLISTTSLVLATKCLLITVSNSQKNRSCEPCIRDASCHL